jgi:hypothetical protein
MITDDQKREWDAYERRNPGVAHPARIMERKNRGRQLLSEDYTRATNRFSHEDGLTFGQRARLQRQRNGGM